MARSSSLDKEASSALGVPTDGISQSELEYLQRRKVELESIESGEPVLVAEVLIAEHNIKRIRAEQQGHQNAKPGSADELELTRGKLQVLSDSLDGYMRRYNAAMDGLGARKKRTKDVQVSPLSELWLRYTRAMAEKK